MRRRLLALAATATLGLALAATGNAAGFTKTDAVVPMDDGVGIATSLYVPEGTPPAAGWPGLMLFHGLGGNRGSMNQAAEEVFAPEGYVVLTFDARAHGESGGLFTLDGPREMADVRTLFQWLAARADVDDAHVGAWGISYGGGAIWRATVEGVPFAAIAPTITWTDLYEALAPQDLPKTGAIFQFSQSVPRERFPAELGALLADALSLRNLPAIRAFLLERSTRTRLSVRVPTFLLQSRQDFAFDIEQAFAGFARLAGPKRLYIGDLGHAPAKNPAEERPYYLLQVRQWFDRFLKGAANGIDTRPPVELAPDPWSTRTASYASRPPTRTFRFTFPGRGALRSQGKIVRMLRPKLPMLETFGAPVVTVESPTRSRWTHLVAVLTAVTPSGQEVVVSEGGTAHVSKRFTIRLLSVASVIPRGSRLRLTLAAASTAQNPGNLLYLTGVPEQARMTVGKVSLSMPVLAEARLAVTVRHVAPGLAVMLALALAAGAAARTDSRTADPGVTATKVLLGGTVPLSGVASAFGAVGPGAAAYFRYVNARGGVHGRQIEYRYHDDGYEPARTVELTRQLVQQDRVFAIFNSVGTPNNLATRPFLNALKVPQLFVGDGSNALHQPRRYPWTMGFLPSYRGEGAVYGRTLVQRNKRARIAVLYENTDLGRDMLRGLELGIAKKGPRIVAREGYEYTDADVSSKIARLKRSRANTLMLFATPKFTIQAFASTHKLSWRPQVYVASVSIEPGIMAIARFNAPELTKGALSIAFVKNPNDPIWAKDPALKLYRSVMRTHYPSGKVADVYNWYGMAVAWTMVETLRKAGRNLTRAGVLRAAQSLDTRRNPFLLPGIRLKTSRGTYFPISQIYVYRYDNRQWVRASRLLDARS